jgi:hypothetical protein
MLIQTADVGRKGLCAPPSIKEGTLEAIIFLVGASLVVVLLLRDGLARAVLLGVFRSPRQHEVLARRTRTDGIEEIVRIEGVDAQAILERLTVVARRPSSILDLDAVTGAATVTRTEAESAGSRDLLA